jgi:hypothetical protein
MADKTHIVISWNSNTCMYQAKVDHGGKTANFALPDAANDWEAKNQANKIMDDYKRETGDK